MISVPLQGKPLNMSILEVYAPTTDAKEAEADQFYEDLQDFLELIPKKKKKSFHHEELECHTRKSSDTWSKSKFGLDVQNEVRAKANRALSREYIDHSKHPLPAT